MLCKALRTIVEHDGRQMIVANINDEISFPPHIAVRLLGNGDVEVVSSEGPEDDVALSAHVDLTDEHVAADVEDSEGNGDEDAPVKRGPGRPRLNKSSDEAPLE